MVREATDNMETGISVGGRIINTIRYADDKSVVANSQKGLQQLMDNLNKFTREFQDITGWIQQKRDWEKNWDGKESIYREKETVYM